MFNLDTFISKFVIKRSQSMFQSDIEENYDNLSKKIKGKSLLIIGGAGSIGSSFIRAILPFKPSALIVVDTNENALTELTRDLRSTHNMYIPNDYITYPMDFSSNVFKKMFINYCNKNGRFDIVGNFSAHKHVRSEKDIYSIEALLQNNVLHARKLLELLKQYPPAEYFCVSTDKAANPVNIMGASKRIMEDLIFAYSDCFPVKTARFANVAFSNGSLPDGFLKRIDKLQPISAPSDIKRYFVSPQESGQICMLSCILGKNREIFFPKLQEAQMMTFDKIATKLLQEKGYEVKECISDIEALQSSIELQKGMTNKYPVYFEKSNTSGEKSYEEFFTNAETIDMHRFNSLGVITGKQIPKQEKLNIFLDKLSIVFKNNSSDKIEEKIMKEKVIEIMSKYLPNFKHIETGKSLDSKM